MRNNPRFHGHWAIETLPKQRIVMIKGKGAWNLDTAHAYTQEFREKSQAILDKPWACIGYGVEWELGTPETEPVLHDLYEWMVENGCINQTTVIVSPVSKSQLTKYIEVKSPTYTMHLVPTIDDLMNILIESGFSPPNEDFDRFIHTPYQ